MENRRAFFKSITALAIGGAGFLRWPLRRSHAEPDAAQQPEVPRHLHQLWLQGRTLPADLAPKVAAAQDVCRRSGWGYTLWTASSLVARLSDSSRRIFRALSPLCCNIVQQSNVARFLILRDFGGLYLDADTELHDLPDSLAGPWIPTTRAMHRIGSFALACPAHDPWIEKVVAACQQLDLGINGAAGSKFIAHQRDESVNVWPLGAWSDKVGPHPQRATYGHHLWSGHVMGRFEIPPVTVE